MDSKGFTGTKEKIFDCSLQLFADKGFENVSVRDIGSAVGIQASSIYNHFKSKEDVLTAIYDYFYENRNNTCLTPEEYMHIVESGTAKEIVDVMNYGYDPPMRMFHIVRLIFMRIYIDERAKELYQNNIVNEGAEYGAELLRHCVEYGRLPKDTNPDFLALSFLTLRLFTATFSILEIDQPKWRQVEYDLFSSLENMIIDPPPN